MAAGTVEESSTAADKDNLDESAFNDLEDLWNSFADLWEKEFARLSRNEETHHARVAAYAELAAECEQEAYMRSVEDKARAGDAAAQREAQRAAAEEETHHKEAVARVASDAEQRRIDATRAAMEDMDAMLDEAARRAAARREEREARRREARRERQEATNARYRPGEMPSTSRPAPAPPPKAPGFEHPKREVRSVPKMPGWQGFEIQLKEGSELTLADVPWPPAPPATVSGIATGDSPDVKKRKLREAVLRWHPDKWSPAVPRFPESERAALLSKVKDVTQRILEEKQRFCQGML